MSLGECRNCGRPKKRPLSCGPVSPMYSGMTLSGSKTNFPIPETTPPAGPAHFDFPIAFTSPLPFYPASFRPFSNGERSAVRPPRTGIYAVHYNVSFLVDLKIDATGSMNPFVSLTTYLHDLSTPIDSPVLGSTSTVGLGFFNGTPDFKSRVIIPAVGTFDAALLKTRFYELRVSIFFPESTDVEFGPDGTAISLSSGSLYLTRLARPPCARFSRTFQPFPAYLPRVSLFDLEEDGVGPEQTQAGSVEAQQKTLSETDIIMKRVQTQRRKSKYIK